MATSTPLLVTVLLPFRAPAVQGSARSSKTPDGLHAHLAAQALTHLLGRGRTPSAVPIQQVSTGMHVDNWLFPLQPLASRDIEDFAGISAYTAVCTSAPLRVVRVIFPTHDELLPGC